VSLAHAALVGLAVLVGSAIPFVPTGEVVSGAAALSADSARSVLVLFAVALTASVGGDSAMLVSTRLVARFAPERSKAWLRAGGTAAAAAERARTVITGHAFSAVLTGRLVPGGRAPVIIALGLGRYPLRQFIRIDVVACAVWAAVYVVLGATGGRLADTPALGAVIAVGAAAALGLVVQITRVAVLQLAAPGWAARRDALRLAGQRRRDGPQANRSQRAPLHAVRLPSPTRWHLTSAHAAAAPIEHRDPGGHRRSRRRDVPGASLDHRCGTSRWRRRPTRRW